MKINLPFAGQARSRTFQVILFAAFISPLLFYWVYSLWLNPSGNYYTNDAEYPYFLNSLAVFKGGDYRYVDHPGTPLEVIGSLILSMMDPFVPGTSQDFITYELAHPTIFLDTARFLLIAAHVLCIALFFRIALSTGREENIVYAAALSAVYFAIHPLSLYASNVWNHNSFNFPFGTLLLLVLYKWLREGDHDRDLPLGRLILLGLGAGFLTSITIYMGGWVVGVMVAVLVYHLLIGTGWIKAAFLTGITGVSALAGFFISVLPVIDRMSYFRNWILGLLTHQSKYLVVPKGQPILQRLSENFVKFADMLPVLFASFIILLAFSVVSFFLFRKVFPRRPGLWAILAALVIQSVVILLSFLDRPLRDLYFLALAAILPVWLMALLEIAEHFPSFARTARTAVSILVLAGVIGVSAGSVASKREEARAFSESKKMISTAILAHAGQTQRQPDELLVLYMYGSPTPCWGLWSGNSKAGDIFDGEIENLCPRQYLLADGLRVSIPNSRSRLGEVAWDIIFACQTNANGLKEYDPRIRIEEHPELDWMCGKAIAAFNTR